MSSEVTCLLWLEWNPAITLAAKVSGSDSDCCSPRSHPRLVYLNRICLSALSLSLSLYFRTYDGIGLDDGTVICCIMATSSDDIECTVQNAQYVSY